MEGKRISIFLGLSLLVHLLALLLLGLGALNAFAWTPEAPPAEPLRVRVQPPPPPGPPPPRDQPTPFVDSAESVPAEEPDPDALFQSDQNTTAMSRNPGDASNPAPNLTGEDPGLNLRNTPYTPDLQSQPTQPSPEQEPEEAEQEQEPQEASEPESIDYLRRRLAGQIQTREENQPNREELLEEQRRRVEAMNRQIANPPSMQFQAQRRQSNLPGGASLGPEDSFGANETDLGRYKQKLYRAIGSRWYAYIERSRSEVELGQVVIQFRVTSDGIIENIEVHRGANSTTLYAISRRSIDEVSGQIGPFSESMRQQLGDFYEEEISFTVH